MKNRLRVRSAEDECGIETRSDLTDGDADFDAHGDAYGDVEISYMGAPLEDRARLLREFISGGANDGARWSRRTFAESLAEGAGFSDREIERFRHLRDGESPRNGWAGVELPRWALNRPEPWQ